MGQKKKTIETKNVKEMKITNEHKENNKSKIRKNTKKNYGKYIKISIIVLVIVLIFALGFMTYQALFASHSNSRVVDSKYKLTDDEVKAVKEKLNEIESVENIDVYISKNLKSKIIKIILNLKSDVEFDIIKEKGSEILTSFSDSNLSYFDIEFFIDSKSEDSEYPRIGYKCKNNSEFSW